MTLQRIRAELSGRGRASARQDPQSDRHHAGAEKWPRSARQRRALGRHPLSMGAAVKPDRTGMATTPREEA